ncbi:MAG: SusC/RagA family TonB-linked outer membrane protein [Tannerellaceae bacterium]|jgi:TonB-linked SusC/RagA family outer membrane protein|nr:SusC/RagA family TonB-linked outer membrane protein [Tannerellaceae bacterium]
MNIKAVEEPLRQAANALQQSGKLIGTVVDELGPITGASLLVEGTANGTVTDLDGRFSMEGVKPGDVIIVSYVGYVSQRVNYTGQPTLSVILVEDAKALGEVVVTALGIKRDKKALGYAMQEVKGDRLTETRDANVANALAGKIAGVQIRQNGTGVGGATNILIRGNNSIAGNNQPLIVVDGVPIDNFANNTADYWGNGNIDKGSGISDISPDDIETMSVLKGPAAAALYGSRAGNGVVMITTRKGTAKGVGVAYNTNYTFETPMQTPELQNAYGQGTNGEFNRDVRGSWGPAMDGKNVTNGLGTFAYSARDNNLYKDFLQTGSSWTNSLDINKAADNLTFRAAVTRMDNQGAMPNSALNRTSITLRSTAELAKWLSVDVKVNYINQKGKNRIKLAADPDNIFLESLFMPRSVGYSDFLPFKSTDWKRPDGKPATYLDTHASSPNNPYWTAYRNRNSDERDRYISLVAFDFTITEWLSLKLRSGMDNYTLYSENIRATGNPYWENSGSIRIQTERFKETNTDFLLTARKNFGSLGLIVTAGGNTMFRSSTLNNDFSGELVIPDFYTISNGKTHTGEGFRKSRKQINSLYATASLSWDNYLYLDLTSRTDQSSTLPKNNSSYSYPSVGGSWVFSQMLTQKGKSLGPLTYGKLRVSWAEVGNDTDPYQLKDYYNIGYDIKGGVFTVSSLDFMANPDLKSESIRSWELGLELRGFNNRIGLDVSYYKKNAFNQILKISVPAATGYRYKLINAGNIQNQGFEIALNATPVQTAGRFRWETMLNWSKNVNKIISLTNDTKRQVLSDGTSIPLQIVAEEGGAYGDMYGYAYERDAAGKILIGDNGLPVRAADMKKLGNNQPEWMLGWSNEFSYKNISLGFLIDMNYGGSVYMGSIKAGTQFGSLARTLAGRDGMVVGGVTRAGADNTAIVKAQDYWSNLGSIDEAFVFDATSVRLRELNIACSLPRQLLRKTPFGAIKAGLVARNLLMIHSKTEGFDPEAGFSSGGKTQGYEYGSMPTMRSIGFNVNVSF